MRLIKIIMHMYDALYFLSTPIPPVYHVDANQGNIFRHWSASSELDFYLGDFGFATPGASEA
jgi:hypothetical protein